jgi:hypothetical protein
MRHLFLWLGLSALTAVAQTIPTPVRIGGQPASGSEAIVRISQMPLHPLQTQVDGTVTDEGANFSGLQRVLKARLQANPQLVVVIEGVDDDLPYDSGNGLLDALRAAGVQQVRFTNGSEEAGVSPGADKTTAPPVAEAMDLMGWRDDSDFTDVPAKMEVHSSGTGMNLVYWGEKPADLKLESFGPDFLSMLASKRYAVVGKYDGAKIAPGSYLEMQSYFAPAKPGDPSPVYSSRMPLNSDPALTPNMSQRLILPFDGTALATHLERVDVSLHLAGGYGTVFAITEARLKEFSPNHPFPKIDRDVVARLSSKDSSSGLVAIPGEADAWKLTQLGVTLWSLSNPPLSATHFAVTGEIRYDSISSGYFELFANFVREEPDAIPPSFTVRFTAQSGPLARLQGSSDWRTFWLPFDSSREQSRLQGLVVNLPLADPGTGSISVRKVRLVQYPDGAFPASFASEAIPSPQPVSPVNAPSQDSRPSAPAGIEADSGIDRKSFLLGIATTAFTLLLISGLGFLFRRLRQRHNERELRRIASLDT